MMEKELKFNLTMISEHHSFEVYGFVFYPKATYESYGSELKVVLLTSINSKVVGAKKTEYIVICLAYLYITTTAICGYVLL